MAFSSRKLHGIFENTDFSHHNLSDFELPASLYLGNVTLVRKLGEMERIVCLNTLAENHTIDLYTTSHSPFIDSLNVHPALNYYVELGKAYYYSKINLNITLPSIETGVPQRIYDIWHMVVSFFQITRPKWTLYLLLEKTSPSFAIWQN